MGISTSNLDLNMEDTNSLIKRQISSFMDFLDGYYHRDEYAIPEPGTGFYTHQKIYAFQSINSITLYKLSDFGFSKVISENNENLIIYRDKDDADKIIGYQCTETINGTDYFVQIKLSDNTVFTKKLRIQQLADYGTSAFYISLQANPLYDLIARNKKINSISTNQTITDAKQSLGICINTLNVKLNTLISYSDNIYEIVQGEYEKSTSLSSLQSLLMNTIFFVAGYACGLTEFKFILGLAKTLIKTTVGGKSVSFMKFSTLDMKVLQFNHLSSLISINNEIQIELLKKYFDSGVDSYGMYSIYADLILLSFTNDLDDEMLSEFKLFKPLIKNSLAWSSFGLTKTNAWLSKIDYTKNNSFNTYESKYYYKRKTGMTEEFFLTFNVPFDIKSWNIPNKIEVGGNLNQEFNRFETNGFINPNILFFEWELPIIYSTN